MKDEFLMPYVANISFEGEIDIEFNEELQKVVFDQLLYDLKKQQSKTKKDSRRELKDEKSNVNVEQNN